MMEPIKTLQNRLVPGLPIDFSPIVALFILDVFKKLLLGVLL